MFIPSLCESDVLSSSSTLSQSQSSYNSHASSISPTHNPQSSQSRKVKPMKPAIRNQKSSNNRNNSASSSAKKYVPSMPLPSKGNAMNNGTTDNNTNGYISPQYGWYVSTTPPTPEQFSHKNSSSSSPRQHDLTRLSTSSQHQTILGTIEGHGQMRCPIPHSTKPKRLNTQRPVFTKGVPNPMGWPSVPM